jgi:hypothetical protein
MILGSRPGSPGPGRGASAHSTDTFSGIVLVRAAGNEGVHLILSRFWVEAPRAFDVDDRANSSSPTRAIGGRLLGDQIDERLCNRGLITPERRDLLALRLQDGVDQVKGSIILGFGDVSDGCAPVPQLVPRGEQEFVMAPQVALDRREHLSGRSVELPHGSADILAEAGEPLDGHRGSVVGPADPRSIGGCRPSIARLLCAPA